MPESRIKRLDVQGFRGVSQRRSLLFEGKSILLFGENGTGKSSFVDALEKFFTGEVFTLHHRAQSLSSQRYGPHIRSTSQNYEIVVTFEGDEKVGAGTDFRSLPSAIRNYLEAARLPVYLLRRRQILDFIESQPRDRYDLLRPYLSLIEVEKTEAAFAKADEELQAEQGRYRREFSRYQDELVRSTELSATIEGITEAKVLRALDLRLQSLGQKPLATVNDIPATIRDLSVRLAQFGDISKPAAISTEIANLEELANGLAQIDIETVASAVSQLRQREAQETRIIYEKVLEDGARWIEQENRKECPLCEQEMQRFSPVDVIRRARARVEQIREILSLRQAVKKVTDSFIRAIGLCIGSADRVRVQTAKIPEGGPAGTKKLIEEVFRNLTELSRAVDRAVPELELDRLRIIAKPLQREEGLHRRVLQQIQMLRQYLESLPSIATAQNLLEVRELLSRVKSNWDGLAKSSAEFKRLQAMAALSGIAQTTIQQARKEVVGEIFEQISDDIDHIYLELHKHHEPKREADASHRNIHLEVRESVQRSVNIKGDFYEVVDVDPRAYYSDAHLDTLGLSIFLALRRWYRRQYPEFNLLILDDVLTSVDAGHAVRLAEVLLTDFSEFQILLTTHDRIWFEHLRDIQARCGVAQNFVNKVIHSWTIEQGPDLREPADEYLRLKEILDNGQPYEIASVAGRLLEHTLQEMRYSLRLPVPAKPGELYEIGDLWPPFYKELKRNYSTLYGQARQTLDSLDVSWPLRNWVGAHFNRWALNVASTVAKEFANAVVSLFDLVFCPSCRRFIAPSSTPLGQIACRCGDMIYAAPGKSPSKTNARVEVVAGTAGALKDATLSTDMHLEWKRIERNRER